jgi:ectoine hydroxylase-related dioxygenase (phytanoyl-CoA dioxygenase family)
VQDFDGIRELGFAMIPGVVGNTEIAALPQALATSGLPHGRAGIRHALLCPEVCHLAKSACLVEIASATLEAHTFPYRATLFAKFREANWLIVWHQDTALPIRQRVNRKGWGPWSIKEKVLYAHAPASALSRIVALRVHLDDSTPRNGSLRVLPRTHKLGVLTDNEIEDLSRRILPVECACDRGGVLAMRPLIVHSSSKAQTTEPRRVLHIEYAASTAIDDGVEIAIIG